MQVFFYIFYLKPGLTAFPLKIKGYESHFNVFGQSYIKLNFFNFG